MAGTKNCGEVLPLRKAKVNTFAEYRERRLYSKQNMTEAEIIQIQNEVFTKLVIDTLKQQRAEGKTEFLLDKYEIDTETKERVRKILAEQKK